MPKQNSYSVTDKIAVTPSIKYCESQAIMSCDNGVPDSTVHEWLRDKEIL